jgi:ATP-dependent Clp protease ATP-binding subunit ClpC
LLSSATLYCYSTACAKRVGISELELMNPFKSGGKVADGLLPLSDDIKRLFERVATEAEASLGDAQVTPKQLVLAMMSDVTCGGAVQVELS